MYNLAHIYIFDNSIEHDFNKSIELLIRSSDYFIFSFNLLCLILAKKFDFNIDTIIKEIENFHGMTKDLSSKICQHIIDNDFLNQSFLECLYEGFSKEDFVYDISLQPISSANLENIIKDCTIPKYPNAKEISTEFYKGFGY